jgi:hypothetical protein
MAWRSGGTSNDEMVANLKRKFFDVCSHAQIVLFCRIENHGTSFVSEVRDWDKDGDSRRLSWTHRSRPALLDEIFSVPCEIWVRSRLK